MTILNRKPLTPYLDLPLRETKTQRWPRLSAAEVIPLKGDAENVVRFAPARSALGVGDDGCAAFWAY